MFAGYTILRVLGAGGMGKVYLASHPRLPRQDALKVLPADLTADPEFRARFAREAELAAGLSHPHIVGIHDRGEEDGQFWISMDYVAGTDLARLLRDDYPGGMPVDQVVPIITALASALDYAHHRGLLHRDVKPANILLTDPDEHARRRVFLADFGIARHIDDAAGLTATKMAVGTVAYAAPEQLKAEAVDGRADQYALACTAFHMLAGVPPYGSSNPAVVITHHVSAPPPSIGARRPELAGLDPVFAAAMAKEPSDRFGSCREFAEQLRQHHSAPSLYAQHTRLALGATAPTLPRRRHPRGKRPATASQRADGRPGGHRAADRRWCVRGREARPARRFGHQRGPLDGHIPDRLRPDRRPRRDPGSECGAGVNRHVWPPLRVSLQRMRGDGVTPERATCGGADHGVRRGRRALGGGSPRHQISAETLPPNSGRCSRCNHVPTAPSPANTPRLPAKAAPTSAP